MRANIKTNIKRGIAVGLIAVMAAVGPMQTLQPTGAAGTGAPDVAKAEEKLVESNTNNDPYIEEVRLAVDKDADKAKQILESEGYEVIDQDLNKDAGSSWNELGDQAVYMGIKRTADESKAIRDMKTMNMLGKYSYTDLKKLIDQNYSKADELYNRLSAAVGEYCDNYNKGDYLALKTHEILNYIVADDSGKKVGDLLLENPSKEELISMFVEGNEYMVSTITKSLILTSEQKSKNGDIWTERMSAVTSYNEIIKQYASEKYGKTTVIGDEKEMVKSLIDADLNTTAIAILDRWDEIRGIFMSEEEMEEKFEDTSEDGVEDEEIAELGEDIRNLSVVEYTKCVKYGKKSLYDFFKLSKSVFVKDITKLYPFVYALSDAQRSLIPYMDYSMLFQTALTRMGLRDQKKNVEARIDAVYDEAIKLASEVSVYIDVDRSMYGPHAASTSRATANQKASHEEQMDIKFAEDGYNAMLIITGVFATLCLAGSGMCLYYAVKELGAFGNGMYGSDGFFSYLDKLIDLHPIASLVAFVGFGATLISVGITIHDWYHYKKISHNQKQLPIPEVIIDIDLENDAGKYVTYHVAKWNRNRNDNGDRADRADLNGDASREWLALYTTTDKMMGAPILADSLVARTGIDGGHDSPGEGYVPLTMFEDESIQNLVDDRYSFADVVNGIWVWYKKVTADDKQELIDDTSDKDESEVLHEDDATKDDAEPVSGEASDLTGSNISSGNSLVIGIAGGGVTGIIIGIFIGLFIRRKKQAVE